MSHSIWTHTFSGFRQRQRSKPSTNRILWLVLQSFYTNCAPFRVISPICLYFYLFSIQDNNKRLDILPFLLYRVTHSRVTVYTSGFQLVCPSTQGCAMVSNSSYKPVVPTHRAMPWFPPVDINLCIPTQ